MIVHKSGIIMADGKTATNNFKKINEVKIEGLDKVLDNKVQAFDVSIEGQKYLVNPYKVAGTDWI